MPTFVPPNYFLLNGQGYALVTGGGYQTIYGPLFILPGGLVPQGVAKN